MSIPASSHPLRDASYYQQWHDQDVGYQTNNWLLDELEDILSFEADSVLELACGNGRFLERAARHFPHVYGCDWALSPRIEGVLKAHPHVSFARVDLYRDLPPFTADLIVSADFLEHLAPDALPLVLQRIDALSEKAFHKIACYDDGHSHLSILSPTQWLYLFQGINPAYRLDRVAFRLGDVKREIAVFSKGRLRSGEVAASMGSRGLCGEPAGIRLNFGCGDGRRKGFLGVDVRPCAGADHCFPAWETGPFPAGSIEQIYSRHMLEHLNPGDGSRTLESWNRLLKPGGQLRLIVPDLAFHALQLLGQACSWDLDPERNLAHAMAGFYGWHDPARGGTDTDAHRWGYTWNSLSRCLWETGFVDVSRILQGEDTEPWHLHVTARKAP